jgi:hypothetical protein
VGKNCRVKAFGWVQVGGESFPKEGCPVGDLLKIMGGPSYMGLHMLRSSYTCGAVTLFGALPPSVMSLNFFNDTDEGHERGGGTVCTTTLQLVDYYDSFTRVSLFKLSQFCH